MWALVPYIFQPGLVFLVDCKASPGNPSLADKAFVIAGTIILFVFTYFCNVYSLMGLGCKLSPSSVAVGWMPLGS